MHDGYAIVGGEKVLHLIMFALITATVGVVLGMLLRFLGRFYSYRFLLSVLLPAAIYFFFKEFFQARQMLIAHQYVINPHQWLTFQKVSLFVWLGHMYVIILTWQLAAHYLKNAGLTTNPFLFPIMTLFMTSAFAYPIEMTGWVGEWWVWYLTPWSPNTYGGKELFYLPWHRVVSYAWGYFVSVFWFGFILFDQTRRSWKPYLRWAGMIPVVAVILALTRRNVNVVEIWPRFLFILPFILLLRGSRLPLIPKSHSKASRTTGYLKVPPLTATGPIALAIHAMVIACFLQIVKAGTPLVVVSFIPVWFFFFATLLRWPLLLQAGLSGGILLAGKLLGSANLMLSGGLTLRVSVYLVIYILVARLVERLENSWERRAIRRSSPAMAVAGEG